MSMLKPDYIDLDGDGNKTEPMKEAAKDAKERDGMSLGGLSRALSRQLSGLLSRKSKLEKELRTENMSKANQNKTSKEIKFTDEKIEKLQKQIDEGVPSETAADLEREMSEVASQLKARGFSDERIDEILEEAFELRNYSELEEALSRTPKQEGGDVDEQMSMLMNKEQEPPIESGS